MVGHRPPHDSQPDEDDSRAQLPLTAERSQIAAIGGPASIRLGRARARVRPPRISPDRGFERVPHSDRDVAQPALVPARRGRAFAVRAGERIKVINTHGNQVVDTWALTLPDLDERMSMQHTRIGLMKLRPAVGDRLYSDRRRPIMTLVEDTSPGTHDLLFPACDQRRYEVLGHEGHHDNCCENFRAALEERGFEPPAVPAPLNLFMSIPWTEDGALGFAEPESRPGDHVVLRAERDLLVVLSCCPQDMIPINGPALRPTEVHVEIY
jgi:hypothetical protein